MDMRIKNEITPPFTSEMAADGAVRKRKVWGGTRLLMMCSTCSVSSPKHERKGWYLWKFFFETSNGDNRTDFEGMFCSKRCWSTYHVPHVGKIDQSEPKAKPTIAEYNSLEVLDMYDPDFNPEDVDFDY